MHGSLGVMQLQFRFKVCSILYLLVIFILLSCCLHSTNHKKTKGKEYIHVTILFIHYRHRSHQETSNNVTLDQPPHILLVHIFFKSSQEKGFCARLQLMDFLKHIKVNLPLYTSEIVVTVSMSAKKQYEVFI